MKTNTHRSTQPIQLTEMILIQLKINKYTACEECREVLHRSFVARDGQPRALPEFEQSLYLREREREVYSVMKNK